MHHATDFTVRSSMGGYWGERRMMWFAAVFWAFMLIGVPCIIFLS